MERNTIAVGKLIDDLFVHVNISKGWDGAGMKAVRTAELTEEVHDE